MRLITPRLIIRPLDLADAPRFARLIVQDPLVWNRLSGEFIEHPQHRIEQQILEWRGLGGAPLAITLAATGQFIGYVGLRHLSNLEETELTTALGSPYWGRGYATEACQSVLENAFTQHQLAEVIGLAYPHDARGKALAGRLGMQFEGVMQGDYRFGEALAVFRLTYDRWRQHHGTDPNPLYRAADSSPV